MYALLIILLSVAPGLAFLLLILRMDREEPEPLSLVLRIVALGGAGALVAGLVEIALDGVPLFRAPGLAGTAASSFLQVAPVEELAKLGVVLLFAWGQPAFNEENDGVVYVGASAVGFAVLENIIYVVQNGFGTGVLRAFTAIPLHVFTAVIMGLAVGRARFAATGKARVALVLGGFLIAWAAHGAYDTFAGAGNALVLLLLPLLGGVAAFGIVALKRGRRLSLLRWGKVAAADVPPPRRADVPPPRRADVKAHRRWMRVVARILIGAVIGFWALLVLGIASDRSGAADAIAGGVLLTILPAGLAVLLEVGWRRERRRLAARPPIDDVDPREDSRVPR